MDNEDSTRTASAWPRHHRHSEQKLGDLHFAVFPMMSLFTLMKSRRLSTKETSHAHTVAVFQCRFQSAQIQSISRISTTSCSTIPADYLPLNQSIITITAKRCIGTLPEKNARNIIQEHAERIDLFNSVPRSYKKAFLVHVHRQQTRSNPHPQYNVLCPVVSSILLSQFPGHSKFCPSQASMLQFSQQRPRHHPPPPI